MSAIKFSLTAEGIEIDHGDRDISAALRNGGIEIAIGDNYLGAEGYERYSEIRLTIKEARAFSDWLAAKLA